MASIDQHGQPNSLRATKIDERVHGGADRSSRVENVVHQNNGAAVQIEGQVRSFDDRLLGHEREVVAVESDVQRPDGDPHALVLLDRGRDSLRKRHTASLNADESEALRACLLLDDLMGDPNDGSPDLITGHDLPVGHRISLPSKAQSSFPASRCRSLKVVPKDTAPRPWPPVNNRADRTGDAYGWYSSAEARRSPLSVPPVTRTRPSASSVAVKSKRWSTIELVALNVPGFGSYSSAIEQKYSLLAHETLDHRSRRAERARFRVVQLGRRKTEQGADVTPSAGY